MSEAERPHILLTNDDGIGAEGLHALADALAADYDLLIIAPDRERSATGHAITVLKELRLEKYERDGKRWGWSFEGRPADCVKMAVKILSKERPFDMVISGINRGQNLGVNTLYSGTVAAAREGVLMGIPSIAFSVAYNDIRKVRFDTAAQVARDLTAKALSRGLPPGVFLNVNVPAIDIGKIEGYAITKQGNSGFGDKFEHVEGHPDHSALYRNVGDRFYESTTDHHDLDDRAIRRNEVSITPLHVDATAYQHLADLEDLTAR